MRFLELLLEHGLGPYFHPIKKRYIPPSCQNQDDSYPKWIVEGWQWILGTQLNVHKPLLKCEHSGR